MWKYTRDFNLGVALTGGVEGAIDGLDEGCDLDDIKIFVCILIEK